VDTDADVDVHVEGLSLPYGIAFSVIFVRSSNDVIMASQLFQEPWSGVREAVNECISDFNRKTLQKLRDQAENKKVYEDVARGK
jgi:hypothetical protein